MSNFTVDDEFDGTDIDMIPGNSTEADTEDDNNTDDEVPVVQAIDDGVAYGYQCAKVVRDNTVIDIPVTLFLDISYPAGSEDLAIMYLQKQLIGSVAEYYGVSNGKKCANPSLDGSTWLVQILSKTTDWQQDDLADSCRELEFDSSTHDCYVYQATLTGSVLDGSMDDVVAYMKTTIADGDLVANSPYDVKFLNVASTDPQSGDTGRDNLGTPSNINEVERNSNDNPSNRQTITIVGGFLVAAFGIAFIGIAIVLYRRRQAWIQQRDMKLDLDLNEKNHRGGTHPSDDDDYAGPEGTLQLRQDLYGDNDDHIEIDAQGNVRGLMRNDEDNDSVENAAFRNNHITFDLGTSFKDQLMGVHGSSQKAAPMGRGGPSRPPDHMVMYGMGRGLSSDGDSDADSWAQTDGTIGSLEQQLEPITAEV